jgi:hypothetical protein
MKKLLTVFFTIAFLGLMTISAHAIQIVNPVSDAFKDFLTTVSTLSRWVRGLAVIVYIVMLLYAGYTRETAGADAEKAKKAIQIIIYSTTGFALIILAPIIVATLGAILGVNLISSP